MSNAHIHPAFAGMLDSFSSTPKPYIDPAKAGILADSIFAVVAAQREADLTSYRKMLKAHDWSFEFSDDNEAFMSGLAQRKQLKALANLLDKDRAIWNSVAPRSYQVKAVA